MSDDTKSFIGYKSDNDIALASGIFEIFNANREALNICIKKYKEKYDIEFIVKDMGRARPVSIEAIFFVDIIDTEKDFKMEKSSYENPHNLISGLLSLKEFMSGTPEINENIECKALDDVIDKIKTLIDRSPETYGDRLKKSILDIKKYNSFTQGRAL